MSEHRDMVEQLDELYVDLLCVPVNEQFRLRHQALYAALLDALAHEFRCDAEALQTVYEARARWVSADEG